MSEAADAGRGRRGLAWPLVVAAIVLAVLAGFAVGRFSLFGAVAEASDTAVQPNNADAGFARDMQVHHAQAIEMAMIEYRSTDDDELRTLAYDIATAQSAQRGEMYGWLVGWGLPQQGDPLMTWMADGAHGHATGDDAEAAMGMATDDELSDLGSAAGQALDCQFTTLMIRHHEGAIAMTEAVADLGGVPRVLATAEQMGATQAAEIDAMQDIRSRIGCSG